MNVAYAGAFSVRMADRVRAHLDVPASALMTRLRYDAAVKITPVEVDEACLRKHPVAVRMP